MKRRCDHCRGKGGWHKKAGRFEVFLSCQQCKGKGKWYDQQRPKEKKVKE